MLPAKLIQSMKRSNVSGDGELTKERTKALLQKATRQQKNEIDALAGVKRVSVNRVYTTGSISAKIAVAIAQTLNVNPLYLTGEVDERGECSDETLNSFLITKGYLEVADSAPKKRGRKPRAQTADTPAAPAAKPAAKPAPAGRTAEMTEEESIYLLRSLVIQAKYSASARARLDEIKALLV